MEASGILSRVCYGNGTVCLQSECQEVVGHTERWWSFVCPCVKGLVDVGELCACVNTFARCFASEGPFLFKNRIAFLKQKC